MIAELDRASFGGWRILTAFPTWPPNVFFVLAIEARSGVRPPQEIFNELRERDVIKFSCSQERKYAPLVLPPAWQETATAEYQIHLLMNPYPKFLLTFPQERGDLTALFQNWDKHDESEQTRQSFSVDANANTAGWIETILEDHPEFQATNAAWQVITDFTNLPGYDYF